MARLAPIQDPDLASLTTNRFSASFLLHEKGLLKILFCADTDVTIEQVRRLFQALDHHAQFVEKLVQVLEEGGHDFAIVDAARALEDLFADLAAAAAEKMVQMRR